ncbi:molybdopterin-guanine dinucleotide biosynthesis protein B [Virgibacillus profundi]|uniref:Molybdopterin-guanine dinucleotide biosynthesis protein B n=1 Tax=Virgibacillus profundi TaxID=2024555 RepID=A0A2A2ICW6_9BACI|nr:molybdopterin-guanine dinucleotide biosynthesis protein B [Virgibacillus profundi]PAV29218.1 molybdopterin-guanine dinucleotide biosynthesis protein B [Virgibacillus profundi]PXY53387.1 molybdopterin-guanine dinucleotide biosynthesis protein B [Virgibacillus profundi]
MQNEPNFPICQIVGYKNSGKTTLMEKLIRYFASQNKQVGTLKHHGHGGEPELVKETDSYKHLEAGSRISAVQGENQLQITINDASSKLDELIQFYTYVPIDILLIEGYKQAAFPKIVLIKEEQDLQLINELDNIIAIGTWDDNLVKNLNYFTFIMEETDNNLPRLAEYITVKDRTHFKKGNLKNGEKLLDNE